MGLKIRMYPVRIELRGDAENLSECANMLAVWLSATSVEHVHTRFAPGLIQAIAYTTAASRDEAESVCFAVCTSLTRPGQPLAGWEIVTCDVDFILGPEM